MRTVLIPTLVVGVLLAAHPGARADDVQAILDKAVKAHGGAGKLAKQRTIQTKSKGTIEIAGGISFTDETIVQPPGQIKTATTIDVNGQTITVNVVFDKDKGWVKAGDNVKDMDDKTLDEMKEVAYLTQVGRIVFLKEGKGAEVSLIGDDKVEGRDVVGLRVASKGHKDVSLYFDKQTGLLSKITRQAIDAQSGNEVSEERIIQDYQEVDGLKVAKKVLINRDGKKFLEAEVTDVQFMDKVDDSTFAKP
jgi:hypothetical protein